MTERASQQQRYSAPTCTLEITGQSSAISQWAGQLVLKGVRFRLWIHPVGEGSAAEHEVLRGDRRQLETLTETVQTYVQRQLVASGSGAVEQTTATNAGDQSFSLRPEGLTRHRLVMASQPGAASHTGTARHSDEASGGVVLSSLQLADLATVIDQFETSAITLPPLETVQQRRRRWWTGRNSIGSAAAVLIMTVGVATVVPRVLRDGPVSETLEQATPEAVGEGDAALPADRAEEAAPEIDETETKTDGPTADQLPEPAAVEPDTSTATPKREAETDTADSRPQSAPPSQAASPTPRSPADRASSPPAARVESPGTAASRSAQSADLPDSGPESASESGPESASAPQAPPQDAAPDNSAASGLATFEGSADSRDRDIEPAAEAVPALGAAAEVSPAAVISAVEQWFSDRWQAQPDLDTSLAYELEIDGNGVLTRITPISSAALLENAPIDLPQVGTAIAPATGRDRATRLRLELRPDGQVIVSGG